jgi:hypothetical protein
MVWSWGWSVGERARNLNGYRRSRGIHVVNGDRRVTAMTRTSRSAPGVSDTQIRGFSSGS